MSTHPEILWVVKLRESSNYDSPFIKPSSWGSSPSPPLSTHPQSGRGWRWAVSVTCVGDLRACGDFACSCTGQELPSLESSSLARTASARVARVRRHPPPREDGVASAPRKRGRSDRSISARASQCSACRRRRSSASPAADVSRCYLIILSFKLVAELLKSHSWAPQPWCSQ